MSGYDREFTKIHSHTVRTRVGYATARGTVTRFVVQLEYRLEGDWLEVVRFDHDPETEMGHDVATQGLHMDVYRDGDKYAVESVFPPLPPAAALNHAEEHLAVHAERYVKRFERWHEIRSHDR